MASFGPDDVQLPGLAPDPGVRPAPPPASILGNIPTLEQGAVNAVEKANVGFQSDIDAAARSFEALYEKKQAAENRAFVDRYQIEYNKRAAQITADALSSPDATKPQFVSLLDQKLAQAQQDTMDDMHAQGTWSPSQDGVNAARSTAMAIRASTARTATVDAHNQRLGVMLDAANTNVVDIARTAAATGDLTGGVQRALAVVNTLEGVVAPDKYLTLKRTVREKVTEDVTRGFIDRGDYDTAFKILDQNRKFTGNDMIVADAANKAGINPVVLVATQHAESGGNNAAVPTIDPKTGKPASSARGLFGFIKDTARQYGLPDDASTASVEQQASAAAAKMKEDNAFLTKALGRAPTPGQTYLAWVLGPGDAVKVLQAPPGTPISAVLSPKVISANPSFLGGNRTVGDVADWSTTRMITAGAGLGVSGMKPSADNLDAAVRNLKMTDEEQFLYSAHLRNLWGPGGVDNLGPDGQVQSRSTLFQAVAEHDGKYYNIPTVWDGKKLSVDASAAKVSAIGWDKFPSYGSPEEADARYTEMHGYMEKDTATYFEQRRANELGDAGRVMSEDARVKLLNHAVTSQQQAQDRAQKQVDEQIKQMGAAYLKEAYSRANGLTVDPATKKAVPLTQEYVSAIKPFISPAEYNGLGALLVGGAAHDNQDAVITLAQVVDKLEPDAYQKIATQYLREKQIKNETYTAWVDRNRSAMKDNTPESPYRAGLSYVKTTLDPGQLLSGPAVSIARASLARATEEYIIWGDAHPNPTRVESNAAADEITRRYQVINFSTMKLALGTSKYFDGKTRAGVTLDDVRSAEKKFSDDVRNNRLTPAQQQNEARLLNDWNEILVQEAAVAKAKPAPAAPPRKPPGPFDSPSVPATPGPQ